MDNLTLQQKTAVEHNGGNIIVSASAGSGKTYVVIQRMIRLITKENVSVKEILAVTFTNLAASEMKEKLKSAIIDEINKTGNLRLKSELDEIISADISTVHSFCLNLLRRYFYVLELDAAFEICDESKKKQLKAQALDNVFEKLYEEKSTEFISTVDCFLTKRTDSKLRAAILDFAAFCESETSVDVITEKTHETHENGVGFIGEWFNNYYKTRFITLLEKFENIASRFSGVSHREKQIAEIIDLLNTALESKDFFELSEIVTSTKIEKKPARDQDSKILKSYHDDFDAYVKEITKIVNGGKNAIISDCKNSLETFDNFVYVYKRYEEEFAKLKREENVVDFSDLEHFACKLLKNPEILSEVKSRYKYVFIDEYQDVNGVQEEIINLISNDNEFMVGDSKQSIYAFRGCNPEFFINKNARYLSGDGTAVSLDKNFRSSESIINTVNKVFSRVMKKESGGLEYSLNPMEYGGLYNEYPGRAVYDVIVKDVPKPEPVEYKGVYSVMKDSVQKKTESGAEEKLILKLILDAIGKEYYDIKEKTLKRISFGDIVVLIRSIGGLGEKIASTLINAGIPVSSETKNSIGEYSEIKSLINLIRLINCARQDIPLANVLLEFFAFTEDELAEVRERGGRKLDFYDCAKIVSEQTDELSCKLKNFFTYLEKIRVISEFATAGEVINRVIRDTEWDTKIIASELGEVKMRRVERFIAASGTGSNGCTVREFCENIGEIVEDITVSEATGENTVKIMTMHASKGLEFPFVIIAGTSKDINLRDATGFYLKDRDLGVSFKTVDADKKLIYDNALRILLTKKIKEQAIIEEIRVFYVALTRAKYELHVIADESILDCKQFKIAEVKKLSDLLSVDDAEICIHNESSLTFNSEQDGVAVAGKEINSELTELIKRNLSLTYAYEKDTVLPVKSSVSEVNSAASDNEYYKTVSIFGESDAEKGTAYHKALEFIDFYKDVGSQLALLGEKGVFNENELSLIDTAKLENIVKMDIFTKIKGYKLYKEQKFCKLVSPEKIGMESNDAKILVQGIVDLIAVSGSDAILIDYKLSKIADDDSLVKKYKRQMELYKLAIEETLNLNVKEVYLVNILQGKSIKIDV